MSHSEVYQISPETRLNVVSSGMQGPTLVFLHFWGGSSRTFSTVTSILSANHFSLAIDFRGWGASSGPDLAGAYSIEHLAIDIEVLLARLNIASFILIGHSMGGKVAQLIAGRGITKGIRGVVLVGPAPPTPLVIPAAMKEQQMTAYSSRESAEFVIRNVLSSSPMSDNIVTTLVEDIMKGSQHATLAWPVYAMLEDISSKVKEINVPVLVLAGELDKLEPVERLQSEVLGNIKGAEMVIVEGSGHMLPFEAPVEVAHHIAEFARKIYI
ncbi:hypothetical protein V502_00022 [Pseudogymnoascus sp. VKM F-4520 (FW-2644)]|nr:hypothetical protein V502_00022 [Pseudogymnoascus sp. VKM F-4520 (FW-2644)]